MASKQTARRTPSSPWEMRWPHCVGRMCWEFSLVSGPSLQALRDWLPSVVRTLHRYYTRVRLLARVPVGLPALAFSHRSAAQLRRRYGPGLPVLGHDVSGRARGLRVSAPVRVVFAVCYRIDTLDLFLSQFNTRPVRAPVYASPPASRLAVYDSGVRMGH